RLCADHFRAKQEEPVTRRKAGMKTAIIRNPSLFRRNWNHVGDFVVLLLNSRARGAAPDEKRLDMRARLMAASVGVGALAGCATGPYATREPWELYVQASPRADGLVHVRTYTLAPSSCYTAGEIHSGPSRQAQSIQVNAVVADGAGGYCD